MWIGIEVTRFGEECCLLLQGSLRRGDFYWITLNPAAAASSEKLVCLYVTKYTSSYSKTFLTNQTINMEKTKTKTYFEDSKYSRLEYTFHFTFRAGAMQSPGTFLKNEWYPKFAALIQSVPFPAF
jgi:hypothetical protein